MPLEEIQEATTIEQLRELIQWQNDRLDLLEKAVKQLLPLLKTLPLSQGHRPPRIGVLSPRTRAEQKRKVDEVVQQRADKQSNSNIDKSK